MNAADIAQALRQDPLTIVFVNVLLEQLGLPIPAMPTLLLAGSLATDPLQALALLAVAVLASLIGELAWYLAGRRYGYRVLTGLCRLSINPGSCVNQTEARFLRWGLVSLLVAKFLPGFSVVAPPVAGALRMPIAGFGLAAGAGAALWAGLSLAAGWLLRDSVLDALALLQRHALGLGGLAAAAFAAWLGWKLWRRARFRRGARLPRIGAQELLQALAGARPPRLIDLRGPALREQAGAIEGAVAADPERLEELAAAWPRDHPIVTLCACPEDAGAVKAAQRLLALGFVSVRPLEGGYEAWRQAREPAS
jgi:membrane protein DedA with SNARE-associated domain/rhodanese-related sulfurtransferase